MKWNNTQEFFKFQIEHLRETLKKQNAYSEELDVLEKKINQIDNDRQLIIIHGDIHKGNLMKNSNGIYLLDWELYTVGDLAYELATHFLLMKYDNDIESIIIDKLSKELKCNKEHLIKDIELYKNFENLRRTFNIRKKS